MKQSDAARAREIPPVCSRSKTCLLPDRHDHVCQPANRHEQRRVRELMKRG